ncbi:HsdM family class I SAM-dependent methyltransferase [Clostridium hydrogenum]|uniref:HsdM family class I SAM-dependent methyltransferase n=1 Tax=Clostridium hydrogenum TaxID=2855764 RepID=UPI001F2E90D3|nr:N-6 DNA methylase [Clostridium hydrogenum]
MESKNETRFEELLKQKEYPDLDVLKNDLIVFKKGTYRDLSDDYANYLTNSFSTASKCFDSRKDSLTGGMGTPDYVIRKLNSDIILVVECKDKISDHSKKDKDIEDYKNGYDDKDVNKFAIDGALHYASFIKDDYNVIVIATSGRTKKNFKLTSFLWPQGKEIEDIKVIENGGYTNSFSTFDEYKERVDYILGRNNKDNESVIKELKKYAKACNDFLRANEITAVDRAGFISIIVLSLTNKESMLFKYCKLSYKFNKNDKPINGEDSIGANAIIDIEKSLDTLMDELHDNIPLAKRKTIKEFFNRIFPNSLIGRNQENIVKYFPEGFGQNMVSTCVLSVYKNIILIDEVYSNNVDIMGIFYTEFLKYSKGDARDKGIVLTPHHITELFCDIAEHFLGHPLNPNKDKILDICTGTGGFLIAGLNRMKKNIDNGLITDKVLTKDELKKKAREQCLYGIEKEASMFTLAYANMKFHGDGKSNLYSCSSLTKDNEEIAVIDGKTTYTLSLSEAMKQIKPIVGMINPPYSIKEGTTTKSKKKQNNGEDSENEQEDASGKKELDFVYSMLSYLDDDGIGIAIIPFKCAHSKGCKEARKKITDEHTLLAVMSMPTNLFKDSDVQYPTCIMVFRAGTKHKNAKNNEVFFARWIDDGFKVVPHNGRIDINRNWSGKVYSDNEIKRIKDNINNDVLISEKEKPYRIANIGKGIHQIWIEQLEGKQYPDDTKYLIKKNFDVTGEWCTEAYIETDYTNLLKDSDIFVQQLKKFALFQYQQDQKVNGKFGD